MDHTPPRVQLSLDVKYYDDFAIVGYAAFADHRSTDALATGQVRHEGIEPYESGVFYKRELPCLLHAIGSIPYAIGLIYIDANVWLGSGALPGLGYKLHEALGNRIPVIGIGKTKFFGESPLVRPVLRASSASPLYVSAVGIPLPEAVEMVEEMHGEFRIPAMIKLADTMSRQWAGD